MNRLQKKCIIAAAGAHLLLVVIMIVGPAFLTSHSDADDTQVIDFIPANLLDKNFTGGGEKNPTPAATPNPTPQQTAVVQTPQPKAEVTPPTPVPPKPVEQPKPVQPVVQKDTPKPVTPKRDPESLEIKPAKAKPNISTTIVTRKPTSTSTTKSDDTAAATAAAAKQRASDVAKATRNLRNGLSSSTAVETSAGFGGGGEAYASYGLVVKSIYEKAWIEPSDASADNAVASVTVTIANDGTVISAQLTTPSGDERTDASIQRALDRVKYIAPFPASMTEKQHTYIIDFNLKAKRSSA